MENEKLSMVVPYGAATHKNYLLLITHSYHTASHHALFVLHGVFLILQILFTKSSGVVFPTHCLCLSQRQSFLRKLTSSSYYVILTLGSSEGNSLTILFFDKISPEETSGSLATSSFTY